VRQRRGVKPIAHRHHHHRRRNRFGLHNLSITRAFRLVKAQATDDKNNREAQAVLSVKAKCEIAGWSVSEFSDSNPEIRKHGIDRYKKLRDEAIQMALAIGDEFYRGAAIHGVITLCASAKDWSAARWLFARVNDEFMREQILKGCPECGRSEQPTKPQAGASAGGA
jgi:hypothetical protein